MLVADLPLPVRTCGVQNHFLGALEDRPRSSPDVPGQQRHPSSSRHQSIEEAATLNAARPEPIADRRAGIHPLGYLWAATLRCGMVVAPKWARTSRHLVRGRSMQDLAYGLRRIPLPRTPVNSPC